MNQKMIRSLTDVFKEENITTEQEREEFYKQYGDLIISGVSRQQDKLDFNAYQEALPERGKRANPYKGKRKSSSKLAKTRKKIWESSSPGTVKRGINQKRKKISRLKSEISELETKLDSEDDPGEVDNLTILQSQKVEELTITENELKKTDAKYAELMKKSKDILDRHKK